MQSTTQGNPDNASHHEPIFDTSRPDFDMRLSLLSHHREYSELTETQLLQLCAYYACGWTRSTIEIEIMLGGATQAVLETEGIGDDVKFDIARFASEDEGRHVREAFCQTARTAHERNLALPVARSLLMYRYEQATTALAGRRRDLYSLGMGMVIESDQGALQQLAECEALNAFQRYHHERHWADEQHHQTAFRTLAPIMYQMLAPVERELLVTGIVDGGWGLGTFDEAFARSALIAAGVDLPRAVRISGEVARAEPPAPAASAEALLRAMGAPLKALARRE